MTAGPAIEARWGGKGQHLPPDHQAWDWELEAHYLALGVTNLVCTLSPQRIILGGGVMRQASLFPLIRRKTLELLNSYIQVPAITERVDEYVVPPRWGGNAGVLGAMALACGVAKAEPWAQTVGAARAFVRAYLYSLRKRSPPTRSYHA